jgi:anti-sigma regulatory factor (Ser/Thr protein kinase)
VELLCESEFIEMRVTDHTRGFDWAVAPSLPAPDSERGRGLFLIRSVMNHAEYIRGENENIMVLRRLRSV